MSSAAVSFIAIEPCDSPCFVPGPYTLATLIAAPPFAVFKGEAEDPGAVAWGIFDVDGTMGDLDRAEEMTGLVLLASEPERDDEAESAREDGARPANGNHFTDEHAWLAFLRSGGTLCKVPDHEGSPHYRMLVVEGIAP